MRRILWLLPVVAICSGCVTQPQTRDQLVSDIKASPTLGLAGTYTADRPFEQVVATLQRKLTACYDVHTSNTLYSGTMISGGYADDWHADVHWVNRSLVQMTIQDMPEGLFHGGVPKGGDYVVALDVVRLSGNRTRLNWYSPRWGWTDSWKATQQWADGKDVRCPNW